MINVTKGEMVPLVRVRLVIKNERELRINRWIVCRLPYYLGLNQTEGEREGYSHGLFNFFPSLRDENDDFRLVIFVTRRGINFHPPRITKERKREREKK